MQKATGSASVMRRMIRHGIAVGVALALAGCLEGGAGGSAPTSVHVAAVDMTITAPPGYCIDPDTQRAARDTAFVAMAPCRGLRSAKGWSGGGSAGMLTVAISGESGLRIAGSTEALAAHFKSEQGRAALSRVGRADTVEVLSIDELDGVLLLHLRDSASPMLFAQLADDHWRALADLRGRVATVTVQSFKSAPLSDAQSRKLLADLVARLRKDNPVQTPSDTEETPKKAGFLTRLLK